MTSGEYEAELRRHGVARGNKRVIPAKDGTQILVYAVRGRVGDLYLHPDDAMSCEMRRAQCEAVIRQIARLPPAPDA